MKLTLKFENINIGSLNFREICRFCLSNKGILLSIFGSKEGDHLYDLPTHIKTILSVEMEEEDGLPSLICHSCLFNVERSIDFKNQCEQADSILRGYIKSQNCKDCSDKISPDDNNEKLGDLEFLQSEEEMCYNKMKDGAFLADVVEEIQEKLDPTEENHETNLQENGIDENNFNGGNEEKDKQFVNNEICCERNVDPLLRDGVEMEETLNEVEEGRFGSEPFSLDLCSVRLQSECQGNPDMEDIVLYPSSHLTDEDQWSDTGSEFSDEFDAVEPTPIPPQSGNNCPTCNKAFCRTEDLQRHQLIHKQEPPYPCDYCDKEFDEKTLLKAHWRAHAKTKPHMCLTCGEAYMERTDLIKHFAIHDLIKPYHCPGCGKAFAYRSDLRKHAIIHTGARPFKCPVCNKTFTRSTNLNKHARVHSGRRPYPCDHCDKMFSSRGDLVRHAVIHTGEKPYACLICSLAFNRKDKLSRHERVHITDRPFVCAECPTSFHRKEELTKHSRFHHFKPDPEYYSSLE